MVFGTSYSATKSNVTSLLLSTNILADFSRQMSLPTSVKTGVMTVDRLWDRGLLMGSCGSIKHNVSH